MFIFISYWWAIKILFAILFQKASKNAQIPKFRIFERYIEFLFVIQFWCVYFWLMNGMCWELSVVCRRISSIFRAIFEINLTERAPKKGPISKDLKFLFSIQF